MTLVAERQVGPDLPGLIAAATTTTTAPPKPANLQNEFIQRSAWKQGVLGGLNVIALVLAVRFALFVAIVGAIVLTYITIQSPDPWRLAALGVYSTLVILPMVVLASRR